MRNWKDAMLALLAAGWLAGCGTTVSVRPESLPPVPVKLAAGAPRESAAGLREWAGTDSARLLLAAEALLVRLPHDPAGQRAGNALLAAHFAERSLWASGIGPMNWPLEPRTRPALRASNRALAAFIQSVGDDLAAGRAAVYPSSLGEISAKVDFAARPPFRAGYFDRFLIAETLAVRGFRHRIEQSGLGVALVGLRTSSPERREEMAHYPAQGVAVALNVVADFSGDDPLRVTLRITPSQQTTFAVRNGQRIPLAVDFTAPLAFSFGGSNDLLLGIRNFLDVGIGVRDAGIYLAEPLDPARIPVVLIHGLSSSPIVWRNVVNEAMRDPVVRQHYQFWYAYYSTGAPLVYSTAQVRRDLHALRARHPGSRALRDLVLVGYSMGGVMAQLLATPIGDHLWNAISEVPIAEVKLDPDDAAEIRESLFWQPVKGVDDVIFIATPHRGTRMADVSFARAANWLIRLPLDFVRFQRRFLDALDDALGGHANLKGRLTGLDDLSSRSPLYQALENAPLDPSVARHSIIGDRGRGDTPDSSDGIVAYWSSHLDGADSEIIVPTGHDAQASPRSEAEIVRILNEDWRKVERRR